MMKAFTEGQNDIPEGKKVKAGNIQGKKTLANTVKNSRRMESCPETQMSMEEITRGLENRWRDSGYKIVLEKMTLTKSWPEESKNIMESLWSWMAENEIETMVEEGEDILDGLETMLTVEGSVVSGEILMDATEIITAIIEARGLVTKRLAPLFQKDGKAMTDRIKRIGRAEGMIRMREESEEH